ncbi:MAG: hypothetical protein H5U37_06915, partial [Caldisericia bacterium]|nr:hypothetical protein [Caldisericia bacterium]
LFKESAIKFIKSQEEILPQLKDSKIVSPFIYKDKYGNDRTIVFGVEKENKIIGRVVINYDRDNPIFLEFAETPPSHLIDVKEIIMNKISLKENQYLKEDEYIYIFPLLYYIHFDVMVDNKKVDDLYFFLNEKKIVVFKEIPEFVKIKKLYNISLSKSYNILSNVVDYDTGDTNLCNNCGPVSGAIILNYWDKNGYNNLQFDYDREKGTYLTTCLWYDMRTNCIWGTPPGNYVGGICYHANNVHEGYNCNYHFTYGTNWNPKYGDVCSEINNSRPLGILVKYVSGPFHWITCYGYYFGYGGYYIYVRDGYGDGNVIVNWDAPEIPIPGDKKETITIWTLAYIYPSY